ncbi:glycoside hydrolase family 16 protein [Pseudoalteromonas fenneropenaei]|uniref:Glycoside hydrolase family 16 protein n=1 Tax=Pseudoalteromonas fenneropenaei TaxID=1737459 RepID=A0ABV7CI19_9GAMM
MNKYSTIKPIILTLSTVGLAFSSHTFASKAAILFDDFSYQQFSDAKQHGWLQRTETGHPGVKGATWWEEGVSFHPDLLNPSNQVMRLTSKTDGTSVNTRQTQICHQRKYFEGTYAARVKFNDTPQYGIDGDGVVQTFYTISPLAKPLDKNYSEMDFEYLPNGGWGEENMALFATSWETFQLTPWQPVNAYDARRGSLQGWHVLVLQVADNKLKYYVDGELFAEHGADVYPEVPMSINFNLWFIGEQIIQQPSMRQYYQDVDWVYHSQNQVLDTQAVLKEVSALRANNTAFVDTVPAGKYEPYCSL